MRPYIGLRLRPLRGPLIVAFAVAGCATTRPAPAPESFEPLRYDYLTPLPLNVASLDVEQRFVPAQGGDDATSLDPVRPTEVLAQMARDRLQTLGSSGHAVFAITDASLTRKGDGFEGSFAVELDIYPSDNTRSGFAEARASGTHSIEDGESTRQALYVLTKQLMDQLNVEFEYQVRHSLHDSLIAPPANEGAPIEEQSLPPPSASPPSPPQGGTETP